jgi:hypothetical protein
VRGEMCFVLSRCFVQVGDGTSGTNRLTPVAVVGLGSGVANVALGVVRLCCAACVFVLFWGGVVGVRLRGLGCCRVLGLQFGGAQRLVARCGLGGLWCDEGCARRASRMVYRLILALF